MISIVRLGVALGVILMMFFTCLFFENKATRTFSALIIALFVVFSLLYFTSEITIWLKTGRIVFPIWLNLGS